jgi:hypothetical protein
VIERSLRLRAASMKIESWPRIFSCPTYSSSIRGRSARSTTSSCTPATLAVTMRFDSSFSIVIARFSGCHRLASRAASRLRMPSPTAMPSGSSLTAATASLSL